MRSRVPHPSPRPQGPETAVSQMGKLGPELCPYFLQGSPVPSSAVLSPTPREGWPGSRPGTGLFLLLGPQQVDEGQGVNERKIRELP